MHHSLRVLANARHIMEKDQESVNRLVVELAAILHDVADHKFGFSDDDRRRIITQFLQTQHIPGATIAQVISIVNTISYSKHATLDSKEAAVVKDADMLDAIGAIGIARAFTYGGGHGRSIYDSADENCTVQHFHEKLFKLKDLMQTRTAQEIAEQRDAFMHEFLDRLMQEFAGKQ